MRCLTSFGAYETRVRCKSLKTWFTRCRIGLLVLTAVASFAAVRSASAVLLAYEPFDYAPGAFSAATWNTGTGFSAAWNPNNTNVNNFASLAGSFSYTDSGGRTLVTSGNRAWATGNATATGDDTGTGTAGNTGNAQPFRDLSFARGATTDETTWISFLGQVANTVTTTYTGAEADGGQILYGRAAALQLFDTGSERFGIGRASQNGEPDPPPPVLANDTWAIFNRGAAAQTVASNEPLNELQFLLVRIDHKTGNDPGNDDAYLWINPDLNAEPSTASALMINASQFELPDGSDRDYNFNRLRIFGGSFNDTVGYGSLQLDEIRIGETFADVTPIIPEPGSSALAAIALACLAARRRK